MAITFQKLIAPFSGNSPLTCSAFTPHAASDTLIFVTVDFSSNVACTFSGTGGTYTTSGGSFPYTDPVFDETATGYLLSASGSSQTTTCTATSGDGLVAQGIDYSGVSAVGAPTVVSRSSPGTGANAITGTAVTVASGSTLLSFCYNATSGTDTITTSGTNLGSGTGSDDFDMAYCWSSQAGSGGSLTPQFTTAADGTDGFVVIQWVLTGSGGGTSVSLGGQSVASTEGTASRALAAAISGQSIASSLGTITAQVGGNVTLSLAGQSIVSTEGSVARAITVAASGLSAVSAVGSPGAQPSYSLAGLAAISSQGSLSASIALALGGQSVASAFGVISATTGGNVTVSLVGQAVLSSEGSLGLGISYAIDFNPTFGLLGQLATFTLGTITPQTTYAVTGEPIASTNGVLVPAVSGSLSGQRIASSQGAITQSLLLGLAGDLASFSEGAISASTSGNVSRNLLGFSLSSALGIIQIAGLVPVPNLIGWFYGNAYLELVELGFSVSTPQKSSPGGTYGPGVVMYQSPAAGAKVPTGSAITLTVNGGSSSWPT